MGWNVWQNFGKSADARFDKHSILTIPLLVGTVQVSLRDVDRKLPMKIERLFLLSAFRSNGRNAFPSHPLPQVSAMLCTQIMKGFLWLNHLWRKAMCPSDETTAATDAIDTQTTTDPAPTNDAPAARTLEQVYEDYEKALADFEGKLDLATDAKIVATKAAQAVAALKQELDALERDVSETFDKVKTYLENA